MSDLIVPAPTIPHLKSLLPDATTHRVDAYGKGPALRSSKSTPQLRTSSQSSPSDPRYVIGALSRTLRGAGDLWQSWRDGLTAEEREHQRATDERRQILRARIKTVSLHPHVRNELFYVAMADFFAG